MTSFTGIRCDNCRTVVSKHNAHSVKDTIRLEIPNNGEAFCGYRLIPEIEVKTNIYGDLCGQCFSGLKQTILSCIVKSGK